jgi:hypothetical protein
MNVISPALRRQSEDRAGTRDKRGGGNPRVLSLPPSATVVIILSLPALNRLPGSTGWQVQGVTGPHTIAQEKRT